MMQETETHNTPREHPPPALGRGYYKGFWGHYKGSVQGMLRGMTVGLALGAAMGVAAVLLMPYLLPAIGMAGTLYSSGTVIAAFMGSGALLAGGIMGYAGGNAGTAAALHAREELRQRYPDSDLHELGHGHHYEHGTSHKKGEWFHTNVGVPGAAMGATVGGLLGLGQVSAPLFKLLGIKIATTAPAAGTMLALSSPAVLAPAAILGVLGLSYGINRSKFKTLFNWTDELPNGDIKDLSYEEKERITEMKRMMQPDAPENLRAARGGITPAQYHEEYHRLYKEYYEVALNKSMGGHGRGLIGGMAIGSLIGGILGALLMPALGVAALAIAPAGGAVYAAAKFTHGGREAGAHAAAASHWEHKRDRLIEQAHTQPSLAQHVKAEHTQHEKEDASESKRIINWRTLLIGIIGGAILGLAIAPAAGPFILGAITAGAKVKFSATALAASSSLLCAFIGASFGLTPFALGKIGTLGDKIYNGIGGKHHDPSPGTPALSPESELHVIGQSRREKHRERAEYTTQPEHERPLPQHVRGILDNPRDSRPPSRWENRHSAAMPSSEMVIA